MQIYWGFSFDNPHSNDTSAINVQWLSSSLYLSHAENVMLPVLCQGLKKSSAWKFCCIAHWIIPKLLKCRCRNCSITWNQTSHWHMTDKLDAFYCIFQSDIVSKWGFSSVPSHGWRMCSLSVGCLLYNWRRFCTSRVGMELKLSELSWKFDLVGLRKYSGPQLVMTMAKP